MLVGPNGAGKTSVLEAIYLLATTRSFLTPRLAECCRTGEESFSIRAELGAGEHRLELAWTPGSARRRCDGQRLASVRWLRLQPVSLWASGDLEILLGPPAARRRFLDRGIVGTRPAVLADLGRYRRALAEKRRLLASGGAALGAWNAVLAEPAAAITTRRAAYVEELGAEVRRFLGDCGFDADWITLDYRPSLVGALEGPAAAAAELDALAARERRAERPLRGPHRDRLRILWRGRPVARAASAGERKLVGLALAAGHARALARRGPPPVLLLDDVDAELDRARLGALWSGLSGLGQVLATSARDEMFGGPGAPAPARVRRLEDGVLLEP